MPASSASWHRSNLADARSHARVAASAPRRRCRHARRCDNSSPSRSGYRTRAPRQTAKHAAPPARRGGTRARAASATAADPATIRPRCGLRSSPGLFAGDGVTTSDLAESLAPFAGRVIVDRTGLQDYFDVDLEWTIELRRGPDRAAHPSTPSDLPGVFTALREQLGLKLDDARGPVDVVIIDSVNPLTPN